MSAGFNQMTNSWGNLFRIRAFSKDFNIKQIGFIPWTGTLNSTLLTGQRFYCDDGEINNIFLYFGPTINYEDADLFTNYSGVIGFNMQFRSGWGYEINSYFAKSKDEGVEYNSYSINFSSWLNVSQKWNANAWSGYEHTYNFAREYLSFFSRFGFRAEWKPVDILEVGSRLKCLLKATRIIKLKILHITPDLFFH